MAAEVVVKVSFQPADPSLLLAASVARNWDLRSASRPPSSLGSFSVRRSRAFGVHGWAELHRQSRLPDHSGEGIDVDLGGGEGTDVGLGPAVGDGHCSGNYLVASSGGAHQLAVDALHPYRLAVGDAVVGVDQHLGVHAAQVA